MDMMSTGEISENINPNNLCTRNAAVSTKHITNADQVLNQFGFPQRYILLMTVLLSFSWTIAAMPVMCSAFINDTTEDNKCSSNNTKGVRIGANGCEGDVQRVTTVSQFDLRGERRYMMEWIASAFMLGNVIGASTLTRLSDKVGRRPILISSLFILGIVGSLTALTENIATFTIGRFIQGICSPGSLLVAWVLAYENAPLAIRKFTTLLFGVMWVVGYCIIAPLAYFIKDWRWLMVACTVPSSLLAVIYLCTIPESLHFLLANGHKQKAARWIKNVEKYGSMQEKNNVNLLLEHLESACPEIDEQRNEQNMDENIRFSIMWQILNHKIFFAYTLILAYLWTSDTFVYYGLSLYTTRLAGNKYWNYTLSGLVELPAYIFAPYVLENFGRRRIVAFMHFLAGASLMVPPLAPFTYFWMSLSCWLMAKFAISCSFICIYVYGSEIFPTTMRNACLGLCAVVARFGGAVAPYIALLGSISSLLPMIFFGSVSLTAGVLTLILPETKGCTLPSLLEESNKLADQYQRTQIRASSDKSS